MCQIWRGGVLDTYFLYSRVPEVKKYGEFVGVGSAFIEVTRKQMEAMPLMIPDIEEQKQIGSFFRALDQMITLYKQKAAKLEKLKRTLLVKLYPQGQYNDPQLRFSEFTNPWQECKCKDVMKESKETGHFGDRAKKLTVKLFAKGVFPKESSGSPSTRYFIRHSGQFIFSKLDFLNCAFGVIPKDLDGYESTCDVPSFDCFGIDPYFLFYRVIQPDFYLANGSIGDGSRKAKRIHSDVFLNMPLKIPSIQEQKKIVHLFQTIDDTIALYQRKTEKLKQMKSELLQNMIPAP